MSLSPANRTPAALTRSPAETLLISRFDTEAQMDYSAPPMTLFIGYPTTPTLHGSIISRPSILPNPGTTQAYFQDLRLSWDLNQDGKPDARALIEFKGRKSDGMLPATVAVPLPTAAWLFGSGLLGLMATMARRGGAGDRSGL